MSPKIYKREDILPLNDPNVMKIYTDCLAENNPNDRVLECIFSRYFDQPIVKFSLEKIEAYTEQIKYLYGQLFYTFRIQRDPGPLRFSAGSMDYNEQPWIESMNSLYTLYNLGTAANVIHEFGPDAKTQYVDPDEVPPTLSPDDSRFEEWYKQMTAPGECYARARAAFEKGDTQEYVDLLYRAATMGHVRAKGELGYFLLLTQKKPDILENALHWIQDAAEAGDTQALLDLGTCYDNGTGVPKNAEKAAYWWQKAAEAGHVQAQFNLGICYDDGIGVPKDAGKVAYWWQKAAEAGHVQAQFNLGICYDAGTGVPKDAGKAAYWWQKAAEAGHIYAQFNLGLCYSKGDGVPLDMEKAAYWWQKAADQGDEKAAQLLNKILGNNLSPEQCYLLAQSAYEKDALQDYFDLLHRAAVMGHVKAQGELGEFLLRTQKDPELLEKGLYWLRAAAEKGDTAAQFQLGFAYDNGKGGTKDAAKAAYWYEKAARQGDAGAQCNLGILYENGTGLEKDPEKAVYWYEKAVQSGNRNAQFNLALCCDNGSGIEKDPQKAAYWYTQAAEQGHIRAQFRLGLRYEDGKGLEKDAKKAAYWYEKAAQQGDSSAQCNLGALYANGNGVAKNWEKAVFWYKKAVQGGNRSAQYNLGNCYSSGNGVAKDLRKAAYLYEQAAKQGHTNAQYYLGTFYANGDVLEKDMEKAAYWWQKAADGGSDRARIEMGKLYYAGTIVKQDYEKALEYFEHAGFDGYSEAKIYAGKMYRNGEGCKANNETACHWFEFAARQGSIEGQIAAAQMREILDKDRFQALFWYGLAAKAGSKEACLEVSRYYREGTGEIPADGDKAKFWQQKASGADAGRTAYRIADKAKSLGHYQEAQEWAQIAVDEGIISADVILKEIRAIMARPLTEYDRSLELIPFCEKTDCPEEAKSLAGDATASLTLYIHPSHAAEQKEAYTQAREAAYAGSPEGMYDLASCLWLGLGVSEDKKAAARWYLNSAEAGYPDAYFHTGYCYSNGIGVPMNQEKALFWYRRAAGRLDQQGDWQAMFNIARFYRQQKKYKEAVMWMVRSKDVYKFESEKKEDRELFEIQQLLINSQGLIKGSWNYTSYVSFAEKEVAYERFRRNLLKPEFSYAERKAGSRKSTFGEMAFLMGLMARYPRT